MRQIELAQVERFHQRNDIVTVARCLRQCPFQFTALMGITAFEPIAMTCHLNQAKQVKTIELWEIRANCELCAPSDAVNLALSEPS